MIDSKQLLNFYEHLHKLKQLKRAGWVLKKVPTPESVAEHSFSLALLALVLGNSLEVDMAKVLTMALLHDIGESIIGDITPHDKVAAEEKHRQETKAIQEILAEVDDGSLLELWLDYDLQRTEEGKLVAQLDKLDAYLQAHQYKLNDKALAEFKANTETALFNSDLTKLLNEITTN